MNSNELIEKVNEFEASIAQLAAQLAEQVGEFKKQLENAEASEDKKFKRVEMDATYYTLDFEDRKLIVEEVIEQYEEYDDNAFDNNIYFSTEERAQEVINYLNKIICVERIRDEYPEVEVEINVKIKTPGCPISREVEIFSRYEELLRKHGVIKIITA